MNTTIAKGRAVSVRTTNGGVIVGLLLAPYRPSYAVEISRPDGSYAAIMGWRVESVAAV